jgi:AcrR family transcriptional regulator
MTPLAEPTRPYRSALRERQAEDTRARILDATLRVMADGVASVSIPAVAREAGVSVPTVYRHFGTKRDLLAALHPHVMRRAGFDEFVPPRTMDDVPQAVHSLFAQLDHADALARAAMVSPASEEARAAQMPRRYEMCLRVAGSIEPKLAKADRERIARLLLLLISSSSLRVLREHLGATPDEAAEDVVWAIHAAIAHSARARGTTS